MCTIIFPWDTTGRNGPTEIFQYFDTKNNEPREEVAAKQLLMVNPS
jgi:hypothetical protein